MRCGCRWIPTALAARNIGIDQVAAAVQAANVDANTGQLNGPSQATLIHVNGQLADAAHWNKQIIAFRNGAPVRIQDVGRAIDQYQNNLCRHLVQRQARHRAVGPAPARLQHHPDRG